MKNICSKKLNIALTLVITTALCACTQEPAPVRDYTKESYDLKRAAVIMRDENNGVSTPTGSGSYISGGSSSSSNSGNSDFLPRPVPAVQEEDQLNKAPDNLMIDPEAGPQSSSQLQDQGLKPEPENLGQMQIMEVQAGETLSMIADENKVPIRTIIDANNLTPPYEVVTGQRLFIPGAEIHVVKSGETLFTISRQYEVDVTSLAKSNNIDNRDVKVGEKLRIPHKNMEESSFVSTGEKISGKTPIEESEPLTPAYSMGEELQGPPTPGKVSNKTATHSDDEEKHIDVSESTGGEANETAKEQQKAASDKKTKTPEKEENVKVSFKDDGKFGWPVKGDIVKKFSSKNDGINIAASEGTKVRAARTGEVVYAGNELKGYGNLVLVKHTDGYLTAYAHMKDIKVKKGDKIGKNSILGDVGSTGKVKSPQLFFAVRKGKEAKNPMDFLN